MPELQLKVNGRPVHTEVAPNTLLVDMLRGPLGLTGTHVGCDTAQCGACTVLLDGRAVKSCNILAVQAQGASVTTVEGLAPPGGPPHPLQEAFMSTHGLQCGFCTPGMVMMGVDIARRLPGADEKTVRTELHGNLCRCTGYQGIVEAIMAGSAALNAGG